ncbi:MAG: Sec-independent protein translocase protein TatB [bacterium]|nr:Sec-independent protein translocase protein TatB [bacterium]
MGNLGWAEIAVIVVVALVVLGPEKLPGAARQIGGFVRQIRKISTGFQQELQNALDEPIEAEARRKGQLAVEESKLGSEQGIEPAEQVSTQGSPQQGEPDSNPSQNSP